MSRLEDDLALVRLREDVKLSPFVRTACLPHSGDDFYVRTGKLSVIAGWGSSQEVRGRLFSFSFILLSFIYLLIFCNRLEFEKREISLKNVFLEYEHSITRHYLLQWLN